MKLSDVEPLVRSFHSSSTSTPADFIFLWGAPLLILNSTFPNSVVYPNLNNAKYYLSCSFINLFCTISFYEDIAVLSCCFSAACLNFFYEMTYLTLLTQSLTDQWIWGTEIITERIKNWIFKLMSSLCNQVWFFWMFYVVWTTQVQTFTYPCFLPGSSIRVRSALQTAESGKQGVQQTAEILSWVCHQRHLCLLSGWQF